MFRFLIVFRDLLGCGEMDPAPNWAHTLSEATSFVASPRADSPVSAAAPRFPSTLFTGFLVPHGAADSSPRDLFPLNLLCGKPKIVGNRIREIEVARLRIAKNRDGDEAKVDFPQNCLEPRSLHSRTCRRGSRLRAAKTGVTPFFSR